jgi:lambda repressor-like predicted transcriptional regulator
MITMLTKKKNEKYDKIKAGCRKKNITLKELCEKLGMSRQNLYAMVHRNRLKNEYVEIIERELDIFYGRFRAKTRNRKRV